MIRGKIFFRQVLRDYIASELKDKSFTINDVWPLAEQHGKRLSNVHAELYALWSRKEIEKIGVTNGGNQGGRQYTLTLYKAIRILPASARVNKVTGEVRLCSATNTQTPLQSEYKMTRREQHYHRINLLFFNLGRDNARHNSRLST